jgi:hypothetical protein
MMMLSFVPSGGERNENYHFSAAVYTQMCSPLKYGSEVHIVNSHVHILFLTLEAVHLLHVMDQVVIMDY